MIGSLTLVKDKNGYDVDVNFGRKFLLPILEETSHHNKKRVNKHYIAWQFINKHRRAESSGDGYIYEYKGTAYWVDNIGVIRKRTKEGWEEVKTQKVMAHEHNRFITVSRDAFEGTEYTKGAAKLPLFHFRIFMLHPDFAEEFFNNDMLDLNHCIIKGKYLQYDIQDAAFYEIVDKAHNNNHGRFVHNNCLEGCPVSSFDRERLELLFNVLDLEYDEDEDAYRRSSRRVFTWLYFIKYHTDLSDRYKNYVKEFIHNEFQDDYDDNVDLWLERIPEIKYKAVVEE